MLEGPCQPQKHIIPFTRILQKMRRTFKIGLRIILIGWRTALQKRRLIECAAIFVRKLLLSIIHMISPQDRAYGTSMINFRIILLTCAHVRIFKIER